VAASEPTAPDELDAQFRRLLNQPDAAIDLAEGALLIAKSVYPELDVGAQLARVDGLAQTLRQRFDASHALPERILALNRFLFDELKFGPNIEDYYDPRNSFLNEVLERRVGIPITLCVLYMEIGRRVGIPLHGVSFPGHFLVKCPLDEGLVVLDPYAGGMSLTIRDLQQRLREVKGGEVSRAIVAGLLVSAQPREILARMLRNLKSIYLGKEDYLRALPLMHWLILAAPGQPAELRDRGMAYLKLECFRAALSDFEQYLGMAPDAADMEEVRGRVLELRRGVARLN
jgi:regulator of sirC expression with transglutaminase-like and TPR domain